MAENSAIAWTDHTFNSWRGCAKVAAGCEHCYAEAQSKRNPATLGIWGTEAQGATRVVASESMWRRPVKWNAAADREHKLWLAKEKVAGLGHALSSTAQSMVRPVRPRVFCGSLMDWAEDWQGPMVNSAGDTLMICPNGHIDGSTWETTPESIECSSECGADMRPMTMADVRARLFALIDATPHLDWLLLTKRPKLIRRMWPEEDAGHGGALAASIFATRIKCPQCGKTWPDDYDATHCDCGYPVDDMPTDGKLIRRRKNVWLLTSVAEQKDADANIPELLKCRDLARVLGVSAEPLIGPVDIGRWVPSPDGFVAPFDDSGAWHVNDGAPALDWVIVGGESGPQARPCNVEWIRSIQEQCETAGVACFTKQLGRSACEDRFRVGIGMTACSMQLADPKGGDPSEWPEDLRVREFPQ